MRLTLLPALIFTLAACGPNNECESPADCNGRLCLATDEGNTCEGEGEITEFSVGGQNTLNADTSVDLAPDATLSISWASTFSACTLLTPGGEIEVEGTSRRSFDGDERDGDWTLRCEAATSGTASVNIDPNAFALTSITLTTEAGDSATMQADDVYYHVIGNAADENTIASIAYTGSNVSETNCQVADSNEEALTSFVEGPATVTCEDPNSDETLTLNFVVENITQGAPSWPTPDSFILDERETFITQVSDTSFGTGAISDVCALKAVRESANGDNNRLDVEGESAEIPGNTFGYRLLFESVCQDSARGDVLVQSVAHSFIVLRESLVLTGDSVLANDATILADVEVDATWNISGAERCLLRLNNEPQNFREGEAFNTPAAESFLLDRNTDVKLNCVVNGIEVFVRQVTLNVQAIITTFKVRSNSSGSIEVETLETIPEDTNCAVRNNGNAFIVSQGGELVASAIPPISGQSEALTLVCGRGVAPNNTLVVSEPKFSRTIYWGDVGNDNINSSEVNGVEIIAGRFNFDDGPRDPEVPLANLSEIGGEFRYRRPVGRFGGDDLEFPRLEIVHGDFVFSDNGSAGNGTNDGLVLDSLVQVGGKLEVRGNIGLDEILMNALQTVGGDLDISSNGQLETISMGALQTVGGDLDISGNGQLETISMGALQSVGGTFEVSGNTAMTNLNMSELDEVSGASFTMINNSSFCAAEALQLFEDLSVGPTAPALINNDGACP